MTELLDWDEVRNNPFFCPDMSKVSELEDYTMSPFLLVKDDNNMSPFLLVKDDNTMSPFLLVKDNNTMAPFLLLKDPYLRQA